MHLPLKTAEQRKKEKSFTDSRESQYILKSNLPESCRHSIRTHLITYTHTANNIQNQERDGGKHVTRDRLIYPSLNDRCIMQNKTRNQERYK